MLTDRNFERIRENIYWERRLKELAEEEDCSDGLRIEIQEGINKLNAENNMIEYGVPYKP